MNPERWRKIKTILENALEIEPAERAAYLREACGADRELLREIELLLEFETPRTDPFERGALEAVLGADAAAEERIGRQIGSYKIAAELGAGGMGTVYLVERADGEFAQRAALKLIKRGMDSEAVLRRFYNERQILASLRHPNIAQLVDGGTAADGRPFFVMEYVEGRNIIEYSDENDLSLDARLELFEKTCAAVSFAHRNLVIHRDLKPSNILVTKDGEIKLLDFGIAKLLKADDADRTATQMPVFTPEYASPEQVRGEKLTTATDVYSLGVILYELLTGSRPYRTGGQSLGDIIKAVCETEPVTPSLVVRRKGEREKGRRGEEERRGRGEEEKRGKGEIESSATDRSAPSPDHPVTPSPRHRVTTSPFLPFSFSPLLPFSSSPFLLFSSSPLRGDLDNIILKALRKEPERRYSSVEQLAEDIFRHRRGLPVTASRDTLGYRLKKFVARNRVAVASAALLLLALVGGVVGTSWQAVRAERMRAEAERERGHAERRLENLRAISNSLVSEIERAIRDLPGSLPARKLLLDRAVEQLDALAADADGNTELQLELVWAYQNLGMLPDKRLGESRKILEKAVALTEKILAARPADPKARERLAMLYLDMIYNFKLRGDVADAFEYNRRAVAIVDEILRETGDAPEFQDGFWTVYYHYALTMQQLGRAPETIETARRILPAAEASYRDASATPDRYNYIKPYLTRTAIGYGLSYAGEARAAAGELQTALDACLAEQTKRPEATILRRDEANIRLQLATALEESGDPQTAYRQALTALAEREKLARDNPKDVNYRIALADAELYLGMMLTRRGRLESVVPRIRRALDSYEKIAALDAERMQVRILAARARAALGQALVLRGETTEGVRELRAALEFYENNGAATTIDAHLKRHYADALANTAAGLLKLDAANKKEARELYARSHELWRDLEERNVIRQSDRPQVENTAQALRNLE